MPVPPEHLKNLIEGAAVHHGLPRPAGVTIRWRGSYSYPTAWAGEGNDDDEQISLCRIEYLGDDRGFASYDPATKTCTDAVLRTGDYAGNPTRHLRHCGHHPPHREPAVTGNPAPGPVRNA